MVTLTHALAASPPADATATKICAPRRGITAIDGASATVRMLLLGGNAVASLAGVGSYPELRVLRLEDNGPLRDVAELQRLRALRHLTNVWLRGSPVASAFEYRVRLLGVLLGVDTADAVAAEAAFACGTRAALDARVPRKHQAADAAAAAAPRGALFLRVDGGAVSTEELADLRAVALLRRGFGPLLLRLQRVREALEADVVRGTPPGAWRHRAPVRRAVDAAGPARVTHVVQEMRECFAAEEEEEEEEEAGFHAADVAALGERLRAYVCASPRFPSAWRDTCSDVLHTTSGVVMRILLEMLHNSAAALSALVEERAARTSAAAAAAARPQNALAASAPLPPAAAGAPVDAPAAPVPAAPTTLSLKRLAGGAAVPAAVRGARSGAMSRKVGLLLIERGTTAGGGCDAAEAGSVCDGDYFEDEEEVPSPSPPPPRPQAATAAASSVSQSVQCSADAPAAVADASQQTASVQLCGRDGLSLSTSASAGEGGADGDSPCAAGAFSSSTHAAAAAIVSPAVRLPAQPAPPAGGVPSSSLHTATHKTRPAARELIERTHADGDAGNRQGSGAHATPAAESEPAAAAASQTVREAAALRLLPHSRVSAAPQGARVSAAAVQQPVHAASPPSPDAATAAPEALDTTGLLDGGGAVPPKARAQASPHATAAEAAVQTQATPAGVPHEDAAQAAVSADSVAAQTSGERLPPSLVQTLAPPLGATAGEAGGGSSDAALDSGRASETAATTPSPPLSQPTAGASTSSVLHTPRDEAPARPLPLPPQLRGESEQRCGDACSEEMSVDHLLPCAASGEREGIQREPPSPPSPPPPPPPPPQQQQQARPRPQPQPQGPCGLFDAFWDAAREAEEQQRRPDAVRARTAYGDGVKLWLASEGLWRRAPRESVAAAAAAEAAMAAALAGDAAAVVEEAEAAAAAAFSDLRGAVGNKFAAVGLECEAAGIRSSVARVGGGGGGGRGGVAALQAAALAATNTHARILSHATSAAAARTRAAAAAAAAESKAKRKKKEKKRQEQARHSEAAEQDRTLLNMLGNLAEAGVEAPAAGAKAEESGDAFDSENRRNRRLAAAERRFRLLRTCRAFVAWKCRWSRCCVDNAVDEAVADALSRYVH